MLNIINLDSDQYKGSDFSCGKWKNMQLNQLQKWSKWKNKGYFATKSVAYFSTLSD